MTADARSPANDPTEGETKVIPVTPATELFDALKALWRKNSRWLGHYPAGAFEESARKQRIIAAVGARDSLLGYLLYRTSREHVSIVHLCVAERARGRGVSRLLFSELKHRTRDCIGIKLRCRRDYPASDLWPKLGFVPVNDRPGRSASGALLTLWSYPHGHPTLFSCAAEADVRPRAALDANVVFDIQDERSGRGIPDLAADWVGSEVEFCVTPEIFVEINRSASQQRRERRWAFARQYPAVYGDEAEERRIYDELRPLFPPVMKESDESDLRHLVKAVAGEAQFFITCDAGQLGRGTEIQSRYGLAVLRPLDLVLHLDTRLREMEYVPTRVAGSLTTVTRMGPAEVERLQAAFLDYARGETGSSFVDALHAASHDPHRTETNIITDQRGEDVVLFSFDLRDPQVLRVPLLRIRRGRLADGLAEHVLWRALTRASRTGHAAVEVTDVLPAPSAELALGACGFSRFADGSRKHVLRVCGTLAAIRAELAERTEAFPGDPALNAALARLGDPAIQADAEAVARLERMFWPAKITATALPTYIVPIQPAFAAQLFDEELAAQELFGAKEHLALSLRNVYYRSAGGVRVPAPARVLWYVSGGKEYVGAGAIRAVSMTEDTVRGPANELYRRFQRLGAYAWRQVLESANGDPHGQLEAFTFTHTELLPTPVSYHAAQQVMMQHTSRGNPFAGPVRISDECFADIYRIATDESTAT